MYAIISCLIIGTYLTVDTMQKLVEEAGYLSVGEMKQMVNDEGQHYTIWLFFDWSFMFLLFLTLSHPSPSYL